MISLIVCYVSDVTSNVRVQNVLQWTLQGISIVLIYLGTQNVFITAIIVILGFCYDYGLHRYVGRLFRWITKCVLITLTLLYGCVLVGCCLRKLEQQSIDGFS